MLSLADLKFGTAGRRAPGPRGGVLLGSLPAVRKDPLRMLMKNFREYGDLVRFTFGPMVAHLVSSPEGAQQVLAENNKNYGKQTRGFKNLRYVLGNGLLTSEGDFWKRQRRIAQPGFHRQKIVGFAQSMVRAAEATAERLEARRNQTLDISAEMSRLTLRIVGETLLGHDPSDAADEVGIALSALLHIANVRTSQIIDLPPVFPTAQNRLFRKSLKVLDSVVLRIIHERRKNPGDRGDLLSMLMEAKDAETGESMNDEQLRDEAMTIFLAGHETTAMALTFTLLCLAQAPSVQREHKEELEKTLQGRSPAMEDLPKLRFNKMVVQEGLRLYPPAWVITRSVIAGDVIDGYDVPAGSIAFVSPYVTHRHPRYWDNPEGFDPRRFEREPAKGAYYPFGGGPRQCIGSAFAMMEAELVLATLARRVRLELAPGAPIELDPSITLRPKNGLLMTVR
ncbi:MAG TPA: cytochrome P450 [Myxococcales bacterium]|nr:cytochrome P450 [Myxococcales bacterium]